MKTKTERVHDAFKYCDQVIEDSPLPEPIKQELIQDWEETKTVILSDMQDFYDTVEIEKGLMYIIMSVEGVIIEELEMLEVVKSFDSGDIELTDLNDLFK